MPSSNAKNRDESKRRLLTILKTGEPIWKDEDHPELKDGAAEWVRKMRSESEARFGLIQQHRDYD